MTVPTINKMVKVYADSALVERLKCGRPSVSTVRNTMTGVRAFLRWLSAECGVLSAECGVRRGKRGVLSAECDVPCALCGEGDPAQSTMYNAQSTEVSVAIVKPKLVHRYLAHLLKKNVNPITAMSNVYQFRQLFAKWVLPYYEDHGWKVPQFPSFGKRSRAPRYNRPSPEQLAKVKIWYEGLCAECSVPGALCLVPGVGEQCTKHNAQGTRTFRGRRRNVSARELWFAATMMLEFAMRNGDIMRLTSKNFIVKEDKHYLNYTPNKTVHSSGRVVKWPIHPRIWSLLSRSDSALGTRHSALNLPALDDEVFDALNREMRSLGFTGTKGAYELRKICIDHIYQRFGAELAVSISGDDIRTIMHYYADPAQPNIGEVCVVDLL